MGHSCYDSRCVCRSFTSINNPLLIQPFRVLIILLIYTVLGTLYNRYVLQLRGFDQIPQFSFESMKYHVREAVDWIKDIMAAYNVGGSGGGLPHTSRSGTANPVSHHTQASEDLNISTNNNFIRPQTRSAPQPNTNPVSHHTQTQSEMQSAQPSSNSPPPPPPKQQPFQFAPRRVELGSRGPTKEEREFMFGEDEDEGEELEDRSTTLVPSAAVPSSAGNSTRGAPTSLNRGDANIAAIRGQDSSEGTIRL